MLLSLQMQVKTADHHEAIRSCSRYLFFAFDCINACEDIQKFITQPNHRSLFNPKALIQKFKFILSVIITFRQYKFESRPCSSRYITMFEWMERF